MANTKTYTVVKDGETLKELKTLAAAKKLADTEGAEVYCEGECVYRGTVETVESAVSDTPTVEEKTEEAEEEQKAPDKYTLTRKMNVRKAPSLKANKLNTSDRDQFAAQRTALIQENDAIEQKLRTSHFAPELVTQIKYRVGKVLDAGVIPEHEITIQERLRQPIQETHPQKMNSKKLKLQEELE